MYLVQDEYTRQLYALKKIRCPPGDRALSDAMHEIDMYRLFKSDYIIPLLVKHYFYDSTKTCITKYKY